MVWVVLFIYFNVWVSEIKSFFQFNVGFIDGTYYQRYMWYLSLLFFFFMIFACIYTLCEKRENKENKLNSTSLLGNKNIYKFFFTVSSITFVPMLAIQLYILIFTNAKEAEPFFSLFNIIQFQTTRLPVYIAFFSFGVFTNRNKWIERGLFDNKVWVNIFSICFVFYMSVATVLNNIIPEEICGLLFDVSINLFIASALGFSIFLFKKYFNKPLCNKTDLTVHAFNIYIIHYVFVHLLQLMLLQVAVLPLFVKFLIVTFVSLILSFAVSGVILKVRGSK